MDPQIRLSTAADRDVILEFIRQNGFNPRDAITWDGLQMLAMTAWEGEKLIGAIPVEPRTLCLSSTETISALHETVVAIAPEFRGSGIGSQLQQTIANHPPANAKLLAVFREEPDSPAYQWYLKNGFAPAMHIRSWLCHHVSKFKDAVENSSNNFVEIDAIRTQHLRIAGMVDRSSRPLQQWLTVHPYRLRYQFQVIHNSAGYALLGVGKMHSDTLRADILEFVPVHGERLIRSILSLANHNGWTPVRFPMAQNDPNETIVESIGFTIDRTFDMLVKSLAPVKIKTVGWRYAGLDYI